MELLRIPLINASEDELEVRLVAVSEGQRVDAGEVICVIESTKAAMELEAPCAGYVRRLTVKSGTRARVGDLVCAITATAAEPVDSMEEAGSKVSASARALNAGERAWSAGRRSMPELVGRPPIEATRRARQLAAEQGLDLAALGVQGIVRAHHVEQALETAPLERTLVPAWEPGDGDRLVVLGAGGHARALVDLIRASRPDLNLVGALDDAPIPPADVLGVPLIGSSQRLGELRGQGVVYAALGVGAVRDNAVRARLFRALCDAGYELPSLVHPRATVESSARMGRGNQIFAGAVVGANVRLGDDTIINSNAVLSHDCIVESHAHVAPGALLAGGVRVGRGAVIGMGVTVYIGVQIGDDVVVPNGTAVFRDRLA